MVEPNFVILYVGDARQSAAFYAELFGKGPVESSGNFAMFALSSGVMLGLWTRRDVKPAASSAGGGEVAITVANRRAVHALHEEWRRRKLRIAQEPPEMDFGFTFTALDADGHRLRVFAPAAQLTSD
jgi:catechol 2,3-dioxygenase-like lactoylglutathione lyase family enzyme